MPSPRRPIGDYEIIFGDELDAEDGERAEFHSRNAAPPSGVHRTISGRFRPLHTTVDPSANDTTFIRAAVDIATSALNQIGVAKTTILDTRLPPRPRDWSW